MLNVRVSMVLKVNLSYNCTFEDKTFLLLEGKITDEEMVCVKFS